jgi:hypothetical protein
MGDVTPTRTTRMAEDARKSTGVLSSAKAGIDATLGQALGTAWFKDEAKARLRLESINKGLLGASMLSTHNAVSEQRLTAARTLVESGDMLKNPETAAAQVEQIIDHLEEVVRLNKEDVASGTLVAPEEAKVRTQTSTIERILRQVKEPAYPNIGGMTMEQLDELDPARMTPTERKEASARLQELRRGN